MMRKISSSRKTVIRVSPLRGSARFSAAGLRILRGCERNRILGSAEVPGFKPGDLERRRKWL